MQRLKSTYVMLFLATIQFLNAQTNRIQALL